MNFGMTVQAGAGEHSVGAGIPLEGVETGQDVPDMPRIVMAAFTQLGRAADQELPMVAAMSRVAGLTVFLHRGMLPEEGPALVRMTFVAEFIHRSGPDHLLAQPSVGFMAVRARHFSLAEGVVGLFGHLAADVPVAGEAEIRLGGLEVLPLFGMDTVTGVAGDARRIVLAHVPEGETPGIAMTGEALRRFDGRIHLPLGKGDHAPALAPFLDMGRPGAVA